jgi:hypothetical protein
VTIDELPEFVRLRDLKALGFGAVDAARLQRRAALAGGAKKLGRTLYVTRQSVVEAIDEAEVRAT